MENKNDIEKRFLDNLRRETERLKAGIPNEAPFNSMTIQKKGFSIVFRPNNYRRQIEVKNRTNSIENKIFCTIGSTNKGQHNKLLSIKNYRPNITIQYGKNKLTGIYHQTIIGGKKETFLIKRDTLKEIEARINEIKANIQEKIDKALNDFQTQFKLKVPFSKVKWSRYEDFIKGEDFINNIPKETIIHDTVFKKVYGEGIEFKNSELGEPPTAHLKNYIKNRAIEDIAPEIAKSIREIAPLRFIIRNCTKKEQLPAFKDYIALLEPREVEQLEIWFFKTFSV